MDNPLKWLRIGKIIFCLAVLTLALVFTLSNVAIAAPTSHSGRYNISRPDNLEVEPDRLTTCAMGDGASGTCHLINATFGGLDDAANAGPTQTYPAIQDYKGYLSGGIGSTGDIGDAVSHPGDQRGPGAFFPTFVHGTHGATNWPHWGFQDNASTYPTDDILPKPIEGSIYVDSSYPGNTDNDLGNGSGVGDAGPWRGPWRAERAQQYWGYPALNDESLILEGLDSANVRALGYIGNPNAPRGTRGPESSPGCSFSKSDTWDDGTTYNRGCHGIYETFSQTGSSDGTFYRFDTIACTQCHSGYTIESTNSKHGTVVGAANCYECHNTTTLSDANQLGDNETVGNRGILIPEVKNCWECHASTSNFPDFGSFVNTTGSHAGRDCRSCHGHGHNITRGLYWNGTNTSGQATSTCGNDDAICHGDSTTTRYVQPLTHGSTQNNVTCNNCHVPAGQPAHNITIPACSKCHNATGEGNASVGESSRYGSRGDTRAYVVPSWDSGNAIYHNGSRGSIGGLKCAQCHVKPLMTDNGVPHSINTTQDSGKNYVPNCRDSQCHGSGGQGTYIRWSHGEAKLTGDLNLSCVDCHNNATIITWDASTDPGQGNSTLIINTTIHTSWSGYNITPFNISRTNQATGEVNYLQSCVKCHNQSTFTSAGDCNVCHGNESGTGTLIIHDDDMGVDPTMDGRMDTGGPNCVNCHDVGNPGKPMVNVSSMNITNAPTEFSMHAYLNNRTGDPGEAANIGDGWVLAMTNCDDCINWNSQRCWACHSNGSQPENGTMGLYKSDPWKCWDCHVTNSTWIGVPRENFSWAPNVTEHIMWEYAPDINTNTSPSTGRNGSCQICHENDIGITSGSVPKSEGLPDSRIANVSHYGQNDSLMTSNSAENSTNCMYCHGNATLDSPNNETWGGAVQPRYEEGGWEKMGNPTELYKCWECHVDTQVMPTNFHNETLNPGLGGNPNCISCHDIGGTGPNLNVSSMNITTGANRSMHAYLNNRTGDPGDTSDLSQQYNWNNRRCWACHSNGSVPNATENKGADGMGVNKTSPWKCWDCHVVNYTTSGSVDWRGERNSNFTNAPNVTEHIMWEYAPDINTNTSPSTGRNGSCQICHENDIGNKDGTTPGATLGMSLIANVSHYGQNDSLPYSSVNSTSCLFCHNDTANASLWGNATQIFSDENGMYQANESQDCWWCHTDNSQQPTSFHKSILNITTAKCELCHFKYKYFNTTQKTKFINETKYNESVHWNSSVIYCTNCHTNTSFGSERNETHPYQLNGANFLPPESGWKWCEDCHVYQAPYPNETQQRHNITDEPQNYQVRNKAGNWQGVLDITDCTVCHNATYYNNATATFNRTSGKDCRWCHTFPELVPASPY